MQNLPQQYYWNRVAPTKKFTTTLDIDMVERVVTYDARIVDFGCGYGRTLNQLYQLGYHNLLGFDFSEAMIKRGGQEYPHLKLSIADHNGIDCESESVDLVLLFAVLTCLADDAEQKKLLDEIWRVLKPGAYLYVNDFLLNNDARNVKRYQKFIDQYETYGVFELEDGAVLRHHSETYLRQLLSGFKQEIFKKTVFTTMNGHSSNGIVVFAKKSKQA
jgi:SAM-dependent methyltransferase